MKIQRYTHHAERNDYEDEYDSWMEPDDNGEYVKLDDVRNASIGFKVSEQNAMAEICQLMASVSWAVNGQGLDPSDSCVGDLASIAERFASVNWGEMYDKFHRQGVNR